MTGASGKFPPDPRRKTRFREIACAIVAKDRSDRNYGLTVDPQRQYRLGHALVDRSGVDLEPTSNARTRC